MNEWPPGHHRNAVPEKFIRGLGETEGAEGFDTLLEEQVHTLINLSESLRDGALNSSINANETSRNCLLCFKSYKPMARTRTKLR